MKSSISTTTPLYIGLMSGTSQDAVDAVLVQIVNGKPELLAGHNHILPDAVLESLNTVQHQSLSFECFYAADIAMGHEFATAVATLLKEAQVAPTTHNIVAIGSHGQTVHHAPKLNFTCQIGDANIIAARTGINTVCDFRRRDLAQQGSGAPLAPLLHQHLWQDSTMATAICNIGGFANISIIPSNSNNQPLLGFDIGPGNTLIDTWILSHLGLRFDESGQWARQGSIQPILLDKLLNHPYFAMDIPKSTGKESFNSTWLRGMLKGKAYKHEDVQATLVELTAQSLANAIQRWFPQCQRLVICGGGSFNLYMLERIRAVLPSVDVYNSDQDNISANYLEGMLFAWLAYCYVEKIPSNLRNITGGTTHDVLGCMYIGNAGKHHDKSV